MEHTQLYTKINSLPDDIKSEINDFIDFLMTKKKPKFGCAKGQIYISPDIDKPLDNFKEYM